MGITLAPEEYACHVHFCNILTFKHLTWKVSVSCYLLKDNSSEAEPLTVDMLGPSWEKQDFDASSKQDNHLLNNMGISDSLSENTRWLRTAITTVVS